MSRCATFVIHVRFAMGDETQEMEYVDSTDDEMPEEEKQPVKSFIVKKSTIDASDLGLFCT